MRLIIVDASVLFSFFKPKSFTRKLIKSAYLKGARLIVPDFALDELYSLKKRICKFCGIEELEFTISFALLSEVLEVVPKLEFTKYEAEALKLLPKHPKDMPYFALALASDCAIWSNEKRFKQQSKVKVYSTSELLKELELK